MPPNSRTKRTKWADALGVISFCVGLPTAILLLLHLASGLFDFVITLLSGPPDVGMDWKSHFLDFGSFWNIVLSLFILAVIAAFSTSKYRSAPPKPRTEARAEFLIKAYPLFTDGAYSDLPFHRDASDNPDLGRCYFLCYK
jgi:hypothetical protein